MFKKPQNTKYAVRRDRNFSNAAHICYKIQDANIFQGMSRVNTPSKSY